MRRKNEESTLSVKSLTIIAFFAALTAVLAQIAIPIPFSPVPISFGLVAVYISGILLKPKHALYSQICYLILGMMGVPVFGGFKGGIGVLFGPTGGYLIVYPLMAWIVAMAYCCISFYPDGYIENSLLRLRHCSYPLTLNCNKTVGI